MDSRTAAPRIPDLDAVEFIRFCYRRRRVGWPELYDEMCAVAARGLFRGFGNDDLADHGIGFSLFDMPALATAAAQIVAEEQALRQPVMVLIAPAATTEMPTLDAPVTEGLTPAAQPAAVVVIEDVARPMVDRARTEPERRSDLPIRFAVVPVGA